jgi:hypothetical protein
MLADYTTLFGQPVWVCVSAAGLFCKAILAALIISAATSGRREADAELGLPTSPLSCSYELRKLASKPEPPPFEIEIEQMSTLRARGVSAQVRRRRSHRQQREGDFGRMHNSL